MTGKEENIFYTADSHRQGDPKGRTYRTEAAARRAAGPDDLTQRAGFEP